MPAFTCDKIGLNNMRLTEHEIRAIIAGVNSFAASDVFELRLFGSRANDQAKGGDIDLLLITNNNATKISLLENKLNMLTAIKNILGEQRIDLKIASFEELQSDSFLQLIYPQSVLLSGSFSRSC